MASQTDICNRALQKIGATRISSLNEASVNARALSTMYDSVRDSELRAHPWNFAIQRATLAADSSAPDWGRGAAFELPSDFLRILPDYPETADNTRDWQIEGRKIYTNSSQGPLYLRYVARVTDTSLYDPLFVEALAARLALELCELLTQSNLKKAAAAQEYKTTIDVARKANAFDNAPVKPWDDEWVTIRR